MLVLHESDTHGRISQSIGKNIDAVIHSGDFCPNASRGNLNIEPIFQTEWLNKNTENFKRWLDGRSLLFCAGNHDFVQVADIMINNGLNVIDLTDKFQIFNGFTFYGFPCVPYQCNEWNFERNPSDMIREVKIMKDKISETSKPLDVLVAHCPLYGVLDYVPYCDEHIGNTALANAIMYDEFTKPKWLLSGHCHENPGLAEFFGVKISQAATTKNIIEIL